MKLVIDTNIVISCLLKDSITRKILLLSGFEFYLPEYSLDEIVNHRKEILNRSGLSKEELDILLSILLTYIDIIDEEKIKNHFDEAKRIIGSIDLTDVPFIALCLAVPNDGIWTNDIHFEQQKQIKVWKTYELAKIVFGNK